MVMYMVTNYHGFNLPAGLIFRFFSWIWKCALL